MKTHDLRALIARMPFGEDFDVDGVAYSTVLISEHAPRGMSEMLCDRCVLGRHNCMGRPYEHKGERACRPLPRPMNGSRHVVPVADIPVLAIKGWLA